MNFEDFVTHISEHNSPYSRGTIHGVLMDTLDCLKHLILDGKSVRFSDLGLFSIGMTSRGEVSKEKVTAASVLFGTERAVTSQDDDALAETPIVPRINAAVTNNVFVGFI